MGIDREVEKLCSAGLQEFAQMSLILAPAMDINPAECIAMLLGHGLVNLPAVANAMNYAMAIEAIEAEESITGEAAI